MTESWVIFLTVRSLRLYSFHSTQCLLIIQVSSAAGGALKWMKVKRDYQKCVCVFVYVNAILITKCFYHSLNSLTIVISESSCSPV